MFFENEKVLNIELDNAPRKIENLLISLKPGVNRLRFITDRPALSVDKSPDLRKLAFMLRNFSLEYANPEAAR